MKEGVRTNCFMLSRLERSEYSPPSLNSSCNPCSNLYIRRVTREVSKYGRGDEASSIDENYSHKSEHHSSRHRKHTHSRAERAERAERYTARGAPYRVVHCWLVITIGHCTLDACLDTNVRIRTPPDFFETSIPS